MIQDLYIIGRTVLLVWAILATITVPPALLLAVTLKVLGVL